MVDLEEAYDSCIEVEGWLFKTCYHTDDPVFVIKKRFCKICYNLANILEATLNNDSGYKLQ